MDEKNNIDGDQKVDEVLLPGFRFHPTDEELVGFYLRRKVQQQPLSIELIKQLDIYKYDPWDLPKFASTGEKEWYFYVPRDRKYRNSARPNRVTGAGFWKATGTDRPIYSSEGNKCIGLKKSLVFYKGRAAKGVKTDWMMHEFRLPSLGDSLSSKRCIDKTLPTNDSWAICRIFKKTSPITPRALSHSWVSPSLPNPNPNPNSSNNHTLNPCISNNNSPPMQSNSNNANNELVDNSIESPYPFSLQDLSTFKPIYPTLNNNNPNNKPTVLNNNNLPFPNMFNPTILDLPPSYILPQLEDPSDQQSFKSNIDASSMLLIGDFNKSCDGNSEFRQNHDYFGHLGLLSEDHNFNGDNNNYQDYYQSDNLMGDLSNLVHFDDDRGMATLGLFSMEGLLPLDVAEAWKTSSTPLVWDCAPLS